MQLIYHSSGIPQGKLIKRQRLPKNDFGDYWNWKDLNIGISVTFYGKTFFLYDCDKWTNDFMTSEGIVMNPSEERLDDPCTESRKQPVRAYKTPSNFDKLRQFIELDRQVLRFFCLWDDRDSTFGELRPVVLHFYLVDDTMEIREVHEANDGRDPFPVLIKRQKLPKDRNNIKPSFPLVVMEISEEEVEEWFSPSDFRIGKTVFVMGRRFLLYDCDNFTKAFYQANYGVKDFEPCKLEEERKKFSQKEMPPYNGFGSLEDSLQSCLSLVPQPPKKDFIKMLENDNKVLRYEATLHSVRLEDKDRRFIISYRLADDMITIFEPPQRNSGILGGKFLERTKMRKPGSSIDKPNFYTPADFKIGAQVEVFKHKFIITNADRYVLEYLESFPAIYPLETINSIREKLGMELLTTVVEKHNQQGVDELKKNYAQTEHQWRFQAKRPEYKWKV